MSDRITTGFLTERGLKNATPETLNNALRAVLNSMTPTAYDDATTGLGEREQDVLRTGGLRLAPDFDEDPLTTTVAKYAAIVSRSHSVKEASERLGTTSGRVRQMVADGSLYSFLIDNGRHVPDFQFARNGLVPNITRVNRELDPGAHPVAVYNWYHTPNSDLFVEDHPDRTVTPLDWLNAGYDPGKLAALAKQL